MRLLRYLSLAALILSAQQAGATLGEPVASIETDEVNMSASHRRSQTNSAYTLHELTNNGVTIREYVSSSGVVFGIAWSGMIHPQLNSLLGSYFADYQNAAAQTARQLGHRHQLVRGSRVIVQKWGHMRDLHGRAYDPSLLPGGVNPNEIQ